MQTECVYPAPRRVLGRTFSVVKYRCIKRNKSVRIDGGMANGISQVSVISGDKRLPSNSSTLKSSRYMCWLQPNRTDVDITVYTLDARLRSGIQPDCLSQPTVQIGNIITVTTCNNLFLPFEKLKISQNLPKSITFLDKPKQKTLLWLLITANPFSIKCEHVQVQTKGTSGVTTMASYNITSKWTTEERLQTTEVPDGTRANIGAVMGGVAATVLAVSVTAFFIVRLIRKRVCARNREGNTLSS
ncbi:uncharacterized protein LOC124265730 isoform X2 [Haliotis rubra]|uniref:uncharacterized protein LOC124265730 isoform X2 n=1 Tax=Haliotis rubra TaxID=36100 RepID=UPI001EE63318|nr:uncharacterized protein LOC124265730 isoform X2 [Haliotis rubra]